MKPIVFVSFMCALAGSARAQAPDAPVPGTPAESPTPAAAAAPSQPSAAPAPPAPTLALTQSAPPKKPGRWLTYVSFAVNAYTYLGATAKAPSTTLTPANRGILYQ